MAMKNEVSSSLNVQLEHVGSAAAVSGSHMMAWLHDDGDGDDDTLIYASHALIHLAAVPRTKPTVLDNGVHEPNLYSIQCSLRTKYLEKESCSAIITALASIKKRSNTSATTDNLTGVVAGFSDGSIHVWTKAASDTAVWKETRIIKHLFTHAVTAMDAVWLIEDEQSLRILIAWGTSKGAHLIKISNPFEIVSDTADDAMQVFPLHESVRSSVKTVYFLPTPDRPRENRAGTDNDYFPLLLLGTAAPRNNQILFVQNGGAVVGALAGHEDWVTSLAYASPLLASGSQDARIRLWKFSKDRSAHGKDGDNEEEEETRLELVHRQDDSRTYISLEAILYGHEESVTSVCWHPHQPVLISSGMDRIILLWSEGSDGVWCPTSRVGSAGGILGGSIGSSLLGYNSVLVGADGTRIVGHAYGGALHVWAWKKPETEAELGRWQASPCLTGHFGPVADLCWDTQNGDYLLTVGTDQTCRLWAPIPSNRCWVELARPQVHGYNLSAIACLSSAAHPHSIATGGEEKEIRVFDAPKTTLNMLQAVCGVGHDMIDEKENCRVDRAFIPSLGLSNKASAADAAEEDTPSAGNYEAAISAMRLPVERDLGAVSLWPEVQKLFGHNTEVYTLTSSFESKTNSKYRTTMDSEHVILASSTKAREAEDAAIRLWDPINGKCLQVLSGAHTSTIASLAFSPDSQYLASAGKDRKLVVWKRNNQDMTYGLSCIKESAHKRIVWAVHFCPMDPSVLASGSRDGIVKIWRITEDAKLVMLDSFSPQFKKVGKPDAVTALAFAPKHIGEPSEALLAIGLESGRLELYRIHLVTFERKIVEVPPDSCHIAAIARVAWRPSTTNDDTGTLHLAACSADHTCRVFAIGPMVVTER